MCQVGSFAAGLTKDLIKDPIIEAPEVLTKGWASHSVTKNRDSDPDNSDLRKLPLLLHTIQ